MTDKASFPRKPGLVATGDHTAFLQPQGTGHPHFTSPGLGVYATGQPGLGAARRGDFIVLQAVGGQETLEDCKTFLCLERNLYSGSGGSLRWYVLNCQAGSMGRASEKAAPEARLRVEYG